MPRHPRQLLLPLLLLLCLALAAVLVGSYIGPFSLAWWGDDVRGESYYIACTHGHLLITRKSDRVEAVRPPAGGWPNARTTRRWSLPGVSVRQWEWTFATPAGVNLPGTHGRTTDVAVHLAYPLAPCLALAVFLHRRRRRLAFRLRRDLCLACGYDIRATPDRCPECGRTVE